MNYKPQDLNYCLVLCSWSFKSGLDVTYHTLAGCAVGKKLLFYVCMFYVLYHSVMHGTHIFLHFQPNPKLP